MSQIYFVEHNGKRYAYRSTSKYGPGKRYIVTVNEYLSLVDETTGEVILKKNRSSTANSIDPADLKTKRFSGFYVLLDCATSIGLRDDLFDSFGMDGDRLLASAVAQVLSGGPLSSVEPTCGFVLSHMSFHSNGRTTPRGARHANAQPYFYGGAVLPSMMLFHRPINNCFD